MSISVRRSHAAAVMISTEPPLFRRTSRLPRGRVTLAVRCMAFVIRDDPARSTAGGDPTATARSGIRTMRRGMTEKRVRAAIRTCAETQP
jgi:hypothetical protein